MSFRKSARRTCLRAGHKAVKAIGQEPDRLQANLVNSLSHFLRPATAVVRAAMPTRLRRRRRPAALRAVYAAKLFAAMKVP